MLDKKVEDRDKNEKFEINFNDFNENQEEKNFHLKKNIEKIKNKRQIIRETNKKNKELYSLNIPQILIDIPQLV